MSTIGRRRSRKFQVRGGLPLLADSVAASARAIQAQQSSAQAIETPADLPAPTSLFARLPGAKASGDPLTLGRQGFMP
jgi:hypothetical protein